MWASRPSRFSIQRRALTPAPGLSRSPAPTPPRSITNVNGITPTTASTLYAGAIALPLGTTTLKAIAVNANDAQCRDHRCLPL